MREVLAVLRTDWTELQAAGELAGRAHARGFTTPVVLVAGDVRQRIHRHPVLTEAQLGRHALLAITAERDGMHVSMTRLVSFGPPPRELVMLLRAAAEVDAAYLGASRPGTTLGDVFAAGAEAYAEHGYPDEWRRHHQGGLTGYRGTRGLRRPGRAHADPAGRRPGLESVDRGWRQVGGHRAGDAAGVEVVTRTPELGEIETATVPRSGIVVLDRV